MDNQVQQHILPFPILSTKNAYQAISRGYLSSKQKDQLILNPNLRSILTLDFKNASFYTQQAIQSLGLTTEDCITKLYQPQNGDQLENLISYLTYITQHEKKLKSIVKLRNQFKKIHLLLDQDNILQSLSTQPSEDKQISFSSNTLIINSQQSLTPKSQKQLYGRVVLTQKEEQELMSNKIEKLYKPYFNKLIKMKEEDKQNMEFMEQIKSKQEEIEKQIQLKLNNIQKIAAGENQKCDEKYSKHLDKLNKNLENRYKQTNYFQSQEGNLSQQGKSNDSQNNQKHAEKCQNAQLLHKENQMNYAEFISSIIDYNQKRNDLFTEFVTNNKIKLRKRQEEKDYTIKQRLIKKSEIEVENNQQKIIGLIAKQIEQNNRISRHEKEIKKEIELHKLKEKKKLEDANCTLTRQQTQKDEETFHHYQEIQNEIRFKTEKSQSLQHDLLEELKLNNKQRINKVQSNQLQYFQQKCIKNQQKINSNILLHQKVLQNVSYKTPFNCKRISKNQI